MDNIRSKKFGVQNTPSRPLLEISRLVPKFEIRFIVLSDAFPSFASLKKLVMCK